jgi:hypothetical protein
MFGTTNLEQYNRPQRKPSKGQFSFYDGMYYVLFFLICKLIIVILHSNLLNFGCMEPTIFFQHCKKSVRKSESFEFDSNSPFYPIRLMEKDFVKMESNSNHVIKFSHL